jgi:putative endonuclease
MFYTYILTNYKNTVLYVGITNNLERRVTEHQRGSDKNSFSSRYRLYKLVWFEEFTNPTDAIAAEKRIKGWTRAKKVALIRTINPTFKNLARS